MTREETITNYVVPAIKRTWNDKKCKEILKALEQEPKREHKDKCETCKHYTSGEHDGSCGSYICKNYSDWESEEISDTNLKMWGEIFKAESEDEE